MADQPDQPEPHNELPGASIAKRLFARGATRASVGSRAEFYHRLGVDDPYAVESGEEGASDGPFSFLSSAGYYRDLRRSRLGLLSRLGGGRSKMGRIGQRAQRIGPAAMATRPSTLARYMGTDAEFELLDDPVLLARAEEEEEGFRWPRTKPRAPRKVGPKPRPMEAAVQREVVEVQTGADELERMIARALQSVRGAQREKLLELLGEVKKAPERNRRAVVRRAVRDLRGPAAAATRADVLASEEQSSRRAAPVAESRADLRRTKGLRPALRRSPAVFQWLEPEAVEEEEAALPPARRRRAPVAAVRPLTPRRPVGEAAPSRVPTSALVARVMQAEAAAIDGGRVSAAPTSAVQRVARRARAGQVDASGSASPVTRAATGYLREEPASRRLRARSRRPVEMAFAEPFSDEQEEAEVVPVPRRRRAVPATVRAVARAAAPRTAPTAGPVRNARRAPLSAAPVRAATQARRRAFGVDASASMAPRPVRRRVALPAANLLQAPPELAEVDAAVPQRRRRRRAAPVVAATQAVAREASVAPSAPASRLRRRLDLVDTAVSPGEAAPQAPTERLMARAFAAPTERLSASPVVSTRPTRSVVGPSVLDAALFALADDLEAAEAEQVPSPTRRRRPVAAAAPVAPTAPRTVDAAAPSAAPRRRRRAASEPSAVRAARRGVAGVEEQAQVATRRRRRLTAIPTSYLEVAPEEVVASITGADPAGARQLRRAIAVEATDSTSTRRPAEAPTAASPARRRVDTIASAVAVPTLLSGRDRLSDELPTVRAARRGVVDASGDALASEGPRRKRRLAAVPTSYLEAAEDDVVASVVGDAPVSRRRRAVEAASSQGPVTGRIEARADEAAPAAERPTLRAARRAADVPKRRRLATVMAAPTSYLEAESDEVVDGAAPLAPVRRRRAVEAAMPSLQRRRTSAPVAPAPSAWMLARGEEATGERRSTLRRAVPSFALGMVLPELLDALGDEEAAQPAPQRRRSLGLAEVAQRTSNAVRAMERSDQSVLTFDAVRRTFGDEASTPRLPTVEARVEVDSEGRVRRVRATRLATGEQVLLEGDDVVELDPTLQAGRTARRPGPAEWAEERAGVGMARSDGGQAVVREAPGARLVERSAVPDVRMRSGVGRRLRPVPLDMLGLARFDDETSEELPGGIGQPRRRAPVAPGASTAAVQRVSDDDLAFGDTAPPRRSRLVPGLGPITLAAAEGTDTVDTEPTAATRRRRRGPAQPAVSRAAARRKGRSARSLGGTLSRLSDPHTPEGDAPASRRLRRRDQPELAWLDGEGDMLDDSGEGPSWARRAGRPSIGDRKLPDIFSKPRVRTSGGLLSALARAGDPEEVVRVILQRSGNLGDASLLAPEAQRLLHRVVGEAGVVARRAGRSDRVMRGSTAVAPRAKTIETNMLDPYGSGGFDGSTAHASATASQGMGASKVMKLANKLMKLIHLAENDGRGDAHKHVRMAENASEARGESGAGQTSGEQFDDKTMNIKALRQDVLDAVLRALEDLRWRREDPDGPSFWC